ncbi:DUF4345 family protein [Aestuariivirga sp.]|uniref:DUF4345 family protein n=1 Tax=Aestuariivirga sp. TaxID=2650926 RepID=UPI003459A3CB
MRSWVSTWRLPASGPQAPSCRACVFRPFGASLCSWLGWRWAASSAFWWTAGRILSILVDGWPHPLLVAYTVIELIFAVAGWRLLTKAEAELPSGR